MRGLHNQHKHPLIVLSPAKLIIVACDDPPRAWPGASRSQAHAPRINGPEQMLAMTCGAVCSRQWEDRTSSLAAAGVQTRVGIWAPEELPVGLLNTYMMLTFLTLAHARGLPPVGYESEAKLEPARKTMEGVEAQCFVAPG